MLILWPSTYEKKNLLKCNLVNIHININIRIQVKCRAISIVSVACLLFRFKLLMEF